MLIVVISPGVSRHEPKRSGRKFVSTSEHARVHEVVSSLQHCCHQQTAARHKDIAEEGSVVRGDGKLQLTLRNLANTRLGPNVVMH